MAKAFKRFYQVAKSATWTKPQDILLTFSNSDLVTCQKQETSRIVFNVGANKYRLIVGYLFATEDLILYIKFVGSHSEYDKVDVCKVDQFKVRK